MASGFEIAYLGNVGADFQGPTQVYLAGGSNPMTADAWVDSIPPDGFIKNTTRNVQFDSHEVLTSPDAATGETSITTSDECTWLFIARTVSVNWPFDPGDYSTPSTSGYEAAALTTTPPPGVVKYSANTKNAVVTWPAKDANVRPVERYFIADAWCNVFIMQTSGANDQADVRSSFFSAMLSRGWRLFVGFLMRDLTQAVAGRRDPAGCRWLARRGPDAARLRRHAGGDGVRRRGPPVSGSGGTHGTAGSTSVMERVMWSDRRLQRCRFARRRAGWCAEPLRLAAAVILAFVVVSVSAAATPNIVLFLADDLGYGELGCYGNREAITPNLDRFAAEGMLLTDCHSASSVCSPSRSSLLTGRMPYRNGVFTWIPEGSPIHLRPTEVTLPTLLRDAGYETCHVGKWHLNGRFNSPDQPQPHDHGYDWWLATQNNAAPSHAFPDNTVRNGTAVGRADDFSAPFVVREAVTWLETRHDRERPFFLAVWTHEPHYPIASAERYEQQHAHVTDPQERTYRANVTQLDDAFGSLMTTLDRLGVRGSTLVFFTSDNGPEGAGNTGPGRGLAGPLRGRKRSMYEGGHRVPGLLRWPGTIGPGRRSDRPVIGSDFFPTALAAAGIEPPEGRTIDGERMLDPGDARTKPMYWRWGGFVAYREGPWKIVATESLEAPELYNLATDLGETDDVASRESARCDAMLTRLRALTAEVEAEGPDWWKGHDFAANRATRRDAPRRTGRRSPPNTAPAAPPR